MIFYVVICNIKNNKTAQAAAHSKASTSACRLMHGFDAFGNGISRLPFTGRLCQKTSRGVTGKNRIGWRPNLTTYSNSHFDEASQFACGHRPQRQAAGPSFVPGPGDWSRRMYLASPQKGS
jgi:hypothetical protein